MQQQTVSDDFPNGHNSHNGVHAVDRPLMFPHATNVMATAVIPRNNNAGEMFSTEKIKAAIEHIIDFFGGATEFAPSIGYWKSERGLDVDHISVVQIVAPYTLETLRHLNSIAATLEEELEQDEIFIFVVPAYFISDLLAINGTILWQRSEDDLEADIEFMPA